MLMGKGAIGKNQIRVNMQVVDCFIFEVPLFFEEFWGAIGVHVFFLPKEGIGESLRLCLVPISHLTYKSIGFKSVMFGCSDL
jgi:hypothetical protein